MTKKEVSVMLTNEELEILMHALYNLMKVNLYQGQINQLEELHNKLALAYEKPE